MPRESKSYWSRAKALVTQDEGWIKPLLVMAAAQLVPIVGQFGAQGYAMEYGRLIAWGVDAAPKQKNVNISSCIRSGARVFCVALVYGLAVGIIQAIITGIFGVGLGGILTSVVSVFASVLIMVACLHATIYQRIGAGFEIGRLSDMVKRDYDGLLRIAGLSFVILFVFGTVAGIAMSALILANIGGIYDIYLAVDGYGYVDDWEIATRVLSWLSGMLPALFVLFYLLSVAGMFINLVLTAAVALWTRQFDVRNWGESSDSLPSTQGHQAASASAAPNETYANTSSTYTSAEPISDTKTTNEYMGGNFDIPQPTDPSESMQAQASEPDSDAPTVVLEPVAPAQTPDTTIVADEPQVTAAPDVTPALSEDEMLQEASAYAHEMMRSENEREAWDALASLEQSATTEDLSQVTPSEPKPAAVDEPAAFDEPAAQDMPVTPQVADDAPAVKTLPLAEMAAAEEEQIEEDVSVVSEEPTTSPQDVEESGDRVVEVIDLSE